MGIIINVIIGIVAMAVLVPVLKVVSGKTSISEISETQKTKRNRRVARRETRAKLQTAAQHFEDNPNATREDKLAYMRDNDILFFRRD